MGRRLIYSLKKAYVWWFGDRTKWHVYQVSRPVKLITGQDAKGLLMRRLVEGKPEYRAMTPEEDREDHRNQIDQVW